MAIDDFSFTSDRNTDKIIYESGVLSYSVDTGTEPTKTINNPYGAECFTTLAWSVDNVNFYPAQALLSASNPYTANAWCDASTIYIYLYNDSGGTVTFYVKLVLDTLV